MTIFYWDIKKKNNVNKKIKKEQEIKDPGMVVVGTYEPYPLTKHGKVVVGYYGAYPPTIRGMLVIGQYAKGNLGNMFLVF
jgi:hypothetical protein